MQCFKCEKDLEAIRSKISKAPIEATYFIAEGNYGSGVFDPLNSSESLRISICDDCLEDSANKSLVFASIRSQPKPEYQTSVWKVEE